MAHVVSLVQHLLTLAFACVLLSVGPSFGADTTTDPAFSVFGAVCRLDAIEFHHHPSSVGCIATGIADHRLHNTLTR